MVNGPFKQRLALAALAVALAATASPGAESPAAAAADAPQREIFVPFSELHVLLSSGDQRVFVTRQEYEELAAKARQASQPEEARQPAALLSADYVATVEEHRARLLGTLVVTAPDESIRAVELDLSGVALRTATLDDKPAPLGRNPAGAAVLFVAGAGRHELKLEILAPLDTEAAQRTLSFQVPTPPATRLRLTVPGFVEIKSGAIVIHREVNEPRQVTEFELLPRHGRNSLVLSLNNRQMRKERVVVAHAVLIDEITTAYERLHVTVSLSVLHGAADQFRFVVPAGFEVTSVSAPQVARWAVVEEEGQRLLDVRLREAVTDTVSLNISAVRAPAPLDQWQLPKLAAVDVAGQATVVGLLLENRLKPYDLHPKNLISIDAAVLAQAMPASLLEARGGDPAVVPVAAFYAPRGDYDVVARFAPPPPELRVTTNVLLTLGEEKLEAHGGFALMNVNDKLLGLDFASPPGWQVTEVTPEGGASVPLETYSAQDGSSRIHVRLPQAAPAGESRTVYFRAVSTPDGWLDQWSTKQVDFPGFQVTGATRDVGAIAVQAQDDLMPRADQAARLTPLDANEKSKYGLADVATELAYRYDAPGYALSLTVSRLEPRLTARAFSFFRVEPDLLTAHYEIAYNVTEARTARLQFALADTTPAELAIKGLDGVTIKESTSAAVGRERHWTVLLGDSRRGAIRLAIDFQQPLSEQTKASEPGPPEKPNEPAVDAPAKLALPLVRALGIAYQSGIVAVEGTSQRDVRIETSLRKADVGELAEADYQVGRRLLGAYGYGGDEAQVNLSIARPAGYELPTVIVERAELLTMVSTSGRSQTAARFQLRAKALLVEVRLPEGSTLWSAYLDGEPTSPQREGGRVLIGLPVTAEASRRTLQLVYETPVEPLAMIGHIDLVAPKLLLRAAPGATADEVPLADLRWQLSTPGDFNVVRSRGTVFTGDIGRESPLARIADAISQFGFSNRRGARPERLEDDKKAIDGTRSDSSEMDQMPGEGKDAADYSDYAGNADVPAEKRRRARKPSALIMRSGESAAEAAKEALDESKLQKKDKPVDDVLMLNNAAAPAAPNAPPPAVAPAAELPERDATTGKQSQWALEGVRSLPIELQPFAVQTTFESLGEQPRISVTVVDSHRLWLLGWGIGLLVFMRGVRLSNRSRAERVRYVAAVLIISLALPLVLPWSGLLAPVCNMAFYAACCLIPFYLVAGLVKRNTRSTGQSSQPTGPAQTVAAALVLCLLAAGGVTAEEILAPVKVPPDAIIVPYDPAKEDPLAAIEAAAAEAKPKAEKTGGRRFGGDPAQKMLVPYDKYIELRRRAHPEEKKRAEPPIDYALAGGQFTARLDTGSLDAGESLLVAGHLDVDVLVEHAVSVPLTLAGGVLTKAGVTGEPGGAAVFKEPDQVQKPQGKGKVPAEASLAVIVPGPGRKRVELAIRFHVERQGGWQIVRGRLPASPASALTLQVAKAGTEVSLVGGANRGNFETKRDGETAETAVAADGTFQLRWRAKAGPAPVDQGLTARSAALIDVQEDGLRLVWRFGLVFRGGARESFSVDVPAGYQVEKVNGGNVRGWRLEEAAGRRTLEVTLLKAAQDSEIFSIDLSLRGSVGSGNLAEFSIPAVTVAGAAQQSGELMIRRSPLLELRTEQTAGVSRADRSTFQAETNAAGEESPLGILPYQIYQFATIPFTLKLSARAIAPRVSAELQTVLKISERQRTLESRIRMRVEDRPIYRLRIALPEDWKLDRVSAPEPHQWVVGKDGDRRLLSLYFAAGQRKAFDIVLSGTLGEYGPADTVALPKLAVVDADEQPAPIEQSGDIAVEADPSLNVRPDKLVNCETQLLARVHAWLNPAQQRLARLAIGYRKPDYAGQLLLSARKPIVRCDTFSNIRVTERIVEETILLDFSIHEAGIRSLSFLLPRSMQGARISAPMLRQKTVEPVGEAAGSQVRVRLELQEEVIDNLRVLIENDRLLTGDQYAVPIATVETGQTEHRYITLESAGRDEIVVAAREGIDPVGQEQAEWRMLAAMLGRGLTQAYLVRPAAAEPLLSLKAKDRAAVETAGARIGLAKTTLVIDAGGAYRGAQLYRVDNSLEQYLEIQLPRGARLWTAHVAGEPVKPAASQAPRKPAASAGGAAPAGAAQRRPGPRALTGEKVRIPLIKTAPGDADYAVVLKYGGELGRLEVVDRLEFPFIRTLNIQPEQSQVELYLPDSFDWFDFGGTMRLVHTEGDLAVGWLAYSSKQIELARQSLQGEDAFAKARAINAVKSLQAQSEAFKQSAKGYDYGRNAELAQQLETNTQTLEGLEEFGRRAVQAPAAEPLDNRGRLNELYVKQGSGRANDVVNQAGDNFSAAAPQSAPGNGQELNYRWLEKNKLGSAQTGQAGEAKGEGRKAPNAPAAKARPRGTVSTLAQAEMVQPPVVAQPAAPNAFSKSEPQAAQTNPAEPLQERETVNRSQRQLQRYTDRLAKQQQEQQGQAQSELNPLNANNADGQTGKLQFGSGQNSDKGLTKNGAGIMNNSAGANKPAASPAAPPVPAAGGGGMGDMGAAPSGEDMDTTIQPPRPAVLASLDVELSPRGAKYLFTTPRGDVEVTARAVSASLVGRAVLLALLAIGLALLIAAGRRWRSRASESPLISAR